MSTCLIPNFNIKLNLFIEGNILELSVHVTANPTAFVLLLQRVYSLQTSLLSTGSRNRKCPFLLQFPVVYYHTSLHSRFYKMVKTFVISKISRFIHPEKHHYATRNLPRNSKILLNIISITNKVIEYLELGMEIVILM